MKNNSHQPALPPKESAKASISLLEHIDAKKKRVAHNKLRDGRENKSISVRAYPETFRELETWQQNIAPKEVAKVRGYLLELGMKAASKKVLDFELGFQTPAKPKRKRAARKMLTASAEHDELLKGLQRPGESKKATLERLIEAAAKP